MSDDDDNYPDPIWRPPVKVVKLEPLPPLPPRKSGLFGWLSSKLEQIKRDGEQADWDRRQRNLDQHCAEFNAAALRVWDVENKLRKRREIEERIEQIEEKAVKLGQEIETIEHKVLDAWAEYQLKRDYWGDVDPNTLKTEFRQLVHSMPSIGLLRSSTNRNVLDIVGSVAALPPPPSSGVQVQAELMRLRRIRDSLPKTTPLGNHDPAERARIGRKIEANRGLHLNERQFYKYFNGMKD